MDSAALESVLLGIILRPGDEVFLATGGGVFLLAGTGDFSFKSLALSSALLNKRDLSGVLLRSLLMGKFLSTGDLLREGLFSTGDLDLSRLNKGFLLSSSSIVGSFSEENKDFRLLSFWKKPALEDSLSSLKLEFLLSLEQNTRKNDKNLNTDCSYVDLAVALIKKLSSLNPLVDGAALTCVFKVVE